MIYCRQAVGSQCVRHEIFQRARMNKSRKNLFIDTKITKKSTLINIQFRKEKIRFDNKMLYFKSEFFISRVFKRRGGWNPYGKGGAYTKIKKII